MPVLISRDVRPFLSRARLALGLTQKELGDLLGASVRTAHRWESGASVPSADQVRGLAKAVFPLDRDLAAGLAQEAGTTLEALGLKTASPARPFPPVALLVDSVVLAALDAALEAGAPVPRQAVQDIVRAAFARAQALGLTVDEVLPALATAPAAATRKAR